MSSAGCPGQKQIGHVHAGDQQNERHRASEHEQRATNFVLAWTERQPVGEGFECNVRLLRRDAGFQTAHYWPNEGIVTDLHGQRHPYLDFGQCKADGHDANHGAGHAVEANWFPYNLRVRPKALLPEVVADYGDIVAARLIFSGKKFSTDCGVGPKRRKKIGRDIRDGNLDRITRVSKICPISSGKHRCALEHLILTTKREVIAIGNAGFPSERANSRHQRNQEQTIRCRERHGPQQHAVNDSENGRVSADANGKC